MDSPAPFLNEVYSQLMHKGDDRVLCAGFERGEWRSEHLAEHIIEWLPEFALKYSELENIGHSNAIKMIRQAARTVYQSEKYQKRGEFGEILLHIAIRQLYETIPAISKIFYKSSANETVKGFDAVHVVRHENGLQLWIGETKFYKSLDRAIKDVVAEILDHLETDYLRSEFIFIGNKIDTSWPEANSLQSLIDRNRSLDEVFSALCIPVLLTYESTCINDTNKSDQSYLEDIKAEVEAEFSKLRSSLSEKYKSRFSEDFNITLHVVFVPMASKEKLIDSLDGKLKGLQL